MPGDSYAGSVNVPFGVETPCSICPLSSGRLWGVEVTKPLQEFSPGR